MQDLSGKGVRNSRVSYLAEILRVIVHSVCDIKCRIHHSGPVWTLEYSEVGDFSFKNKPKLGYNFFYVPICVTFFCGKKF